jgi:uncharacterized protein (DUF58 family)
MGRTQPKETLDTNSRFHELEWRIQHAGWVVVALFLALAFAGLFGGGPLSHAHAQSAQGRVNYERFVRQGSPTELVITPTSGTEHGISRVEITADYLEAFRINNITPEPSTVRISGARLVYEFAAATPGASISFHFDPQRLWRHRATLVIDGGAPLEIWQLTYP